MELQNAGSVLRDGGLAMRVLLLPMILPMGLALAGCGGDTVTRRVSGDGSSLGEALIVRAEAGGLDGHVAVYDWINEHRPGARLIGQGELERGGRRYDVVAISRRGVDEHIYFDITDVDG